MHRRRRRIGAGLIFRRALTVAVLWTGAALATEGGPLGPPVSPEMAWDIAQSAACSAAIDTATRAHDLPAGLLEAIGKVESGRPITGMDDIRPWPWTIEADEFGLYLPGKAAAVFWVQQALGQGRRSIDVGCLQVNLLAHPQAFASLEEAFDPVANADYAARYLRELHDEAGGDWDTATGLYHSHTPDLAMAYRARVADIAAGRVPSMGPEPLYRRALRQGTLRLALAGGGSLRVTTSRQPALRRSRRSPCEIAALLAPLLSRPPRVAGCGGHG
jgi:hypothetical protein